MLPELLDSKGRTQKGQKKGAGRAPKKRGRGGAHDEGGRGAAAAAPRWPGARVCVSVRSDDKAPPPPASSCLPVGEGRAEGAGALGGGGGSKGSPEKEFIQELEAAGPGQVGPPEASTCALSVLERGARPDHYHILIASRKGHL